MNIDNFTTPLGIITLTIFFNGQPAATITNKAISTFIESPNVTIEVIAFENFAEWMKETIYPVEKTKGWIIRITKNTDDIEAVKLNCLLKSEEVEITGDPDGGQHLDAISFENKTHCLSIGTEDGEVVKYRAVHNDYIPTRFAKDLGYSSKEFSFTTYLKLGLETTIPELKKGEEVYF